MGFAPNVTLTHLATWVNNGLRRETKREIKTIWFHLKYGVNNMEVKRICQWCGKPFIAQKTTTNYCSPQCSKRGYKHRMKERRMELIQSQDLLEVKKRLENQEYFTFSQAAKLMGVSRQYIYKLVKEDKLRASRISSRMSFIRRTDIELLLKSKQHSP